MKKSILLIALISLTTFGLDAKNKELPGVQPVNNSSEKLMEKSESCFPPTAYVTLNLNNVEFGIESSGLLWYDQSNPLYEVPSGQGVNALFAGGLWMGGRTPDQQLKLAAVLYRQGGATDYWNGPLSVDGSATALNVLCQKYDRHYHTRLADVQLHNLYWSTLECIAAGECPPEAINEPPFENGYSYPAYFDEWPGNNPTEGFAFRLAPFGERVGTEGENGIYNPAEGDFPGYDIAGDVDCRSRGPQDLIPLFGDENLWWVFNDNGGIHTGSTDGEPIGMEIQAQAFVYGTTDEINNMTFYNYVMINRGVQTLQNTYFGQYADADVGFSEDDYVGCDVQRGLGYTYNGDEFDESVSGTPGYGDDPPAVGIDFFEGPYMDADGINNLIDPNPNLWESENAIPYPGIGLGFYDPNVDEPDTIVDNERLGMSKFVYYDRQRTNPQTDPGNAVEFYNYLTGRWQNGAPFTYGGDGLGGDVICDYVVPGDSDPLGYGTNGLVQEPWSEETDGNEKGDRRFLQSAGPFTLDPGEFNNITVGVVWAQAPGGIDALRDALFIADDKAQALFDNCFQILDGPGAPGLAIQELDQEIILYLSQTDATESYVESDASIPDGEDKNYRFEGYKVYQLFDGTVKAADLEDAERARLITQVDIDNGVDDIFNVTAVAGSGGFNYVEEVQGTDDGIKHSFRVVTDKFSGGALINHKPYYFMVIAYAYNEWAPFSIAQDGTGEGQATPYLEGRLSYNNSEITAIKGIPHKTESETNGSIISASYGDLLPLTRVEGVGTGDNFLELSQKSIDEIMDGSPWIVDELEYKAGGSPVAIKVIDPLNVKDGDFKIRFFHSEDGNPSEGAEIDATETKWEIIDGSGTVIGESSKTLSVQEEYLLLDYGISIELVQKEVTDFTTIQGGRPEFIGATMTFDDPSNEWLTGVNDVDVFSEQNWIRSGTAQGDCPEGVDQEDADVNDECYYNAVNSGVPDPNSEYAGVLGGTVSPWITAGHNWNGPVDIANNNNSTSTRFEEINNVDIILTDDKSKWSRVPVLEIQKFPVNTDGGMAFKLYPRVALSVDKNGKNILEGGNADEISYFGAQNITQSFLDDDMWPGSSGQSFNDDVKESWKKLVWGGDWNNHPDEDLIGKSFGYGWFPGYAIDVETGERLNMAFGENSYLGTENGDDMIWNPTSQMWNPFLETESAANAKFGGMHYIYVFRNEARRKGDNDRVGSYDGAKRFFKYAYAKPVGLRKSAMTSISWVMLPLLKEGFELKSVQDGLIPNEVSIKLRVKKPYQRYPTIAKHFEAPYLAPDGLFDYDDVDLYDDDMAALSENDWFPLYKFSTKGATTVINDLPTAESALDLINVVPNPYYAFSYYENSRLDNRVKIINLPPECTIKIFNTSGTLVRSLAKDNDLTYLEWDLKNEYSIPISGGAYIFYIDAPGIGNKVVKWFGVTRKLDLNDF